MLFFSEVVSDSTLDLAMVADVAVVSSEFEVSSAVSDVSASVVVLAQAVSAMARKLARIKFFMP